MTIKTKRQIVSYEQGRISVISLLVLITITFGFYGYFVSTSIFNVVDRQETEKRISELNSKVISLESEYVKIKNSISVSEAEVNGFVVVSNQKFINPAGESVSGLSLNLR